MKLLGLSSKKKQEKFLFYAYAILIPIAVCIVTDFILKFAGIYGPNGIFVFGVVCIAALFAICVRWLYKDGRLRLSHIIVLWVMLSGTAIMASTVFLAYIGSAQIAESLSATVASTMIAEAIGYAASSAGEHIANTLTSNTGNIISVNDTPISEIIPNETDSNSVEGLENYNDGSVG